ncbi:hypothetical protein BBW65_01110 [Helicobacter enhydrae]|uniref:Uncharacterized protein n=1 Tax=Helicobacter enhydrae TaxID=222136 RepID=A0A1B1U416_9HELI|nr:HAD-IIIA family hydrolase [Helicobacter enhydrae]ANV97496.1 hypothetical protein BBW65_01110 [Helicobacter enhydrae]
MKTQIEWLLLDVDGTLTDGLVSYGEDCEIKAFNIKDGLGLRIWKKRGKKIAIITGRESSAVARRAQELGVDALYMGVMDKAKVVLELQEKHQVSRVQMACVGDDLNDLPMFKLCGLSFAPKDCAKDVALRADVVLQNAGGRGAIREAIEMILEEEWEEIVEDFSN